MTATAVPATEHRIYALEQYLAQKEQAIGRARKPLHEVLYSEQVIEL